MKAKKQVGCWGVSAVLVVFVGYFGMFSFGWTSFAIGFAIAAVFIVLEIFSAPSSDPLLGVPVPQRLQSSLAKLKGASQHYIPTDKKSGVAVNETAKKICFISPQDEFDRSIRLAQLVKSYKKEKGLNESAPVIWFNTLLKSRRTTILLRVLTSGFMTFETFFQSK